MSHNIDTQINNIEEQIMILKDKKEILSKQKNKDLPNAFEILKAGQKNPKKRDRNIYEESDYINFKKMIGTSHNAPGSKIDEKADEVNVLESLNEEERKLLSGPKKPTRQQYPDEVKKIVGKLAVSFTKKKVEEATGISKDNIKRWKKDYKAEKTPVKRGRRVNSQELESYILNWIKDQRKKFNHVSVRRMLREARVKSKNLKLDNMKLTWGWVQKFLKRNGLKLKKPSTKVKMNPKPVLEAVEKFKTKIATLMSTGNYPEEFVINMDETSVCCESTKTKTIHVPEEAKGDGAFEEEKDPSKKHIAVKSVGKDKANLTVVLAGSWAGNKLKGMLIFPDKGVKALKEKVPENIFVAHREDGSWLDRKMMQKWLTYVLRPYAFNLPEDKRGLLILDNHAGHLDASIREYISKLRFDVESLPPNTTKYAQPLDLSTNKPFKGYHDEQWEDYAAKLTDKDLTKSGYYKPPTREDRMEWISWSWAQISSTTMSNGFNIYKRALNSLINLENQFMDELDRYEASFQEVVDEKPVENSSNDNLLDSSSEEDQDELDERDKEFFAEEMLDYLVLYKDE